RLRRTVLDLVRGAGFYEYFDPTSGRGHGSDFFSWTAALLLDILHESPEENGS
ncbi:MAG: glycoside hydrolase, partial [Rubrobacter sp.]|nr:glycoside hydrolase [Rubrobacter sp.]